VIDPATFAACSLRMYNSLVERCFTECVDSFRRKDLDSAEEKVRPPTAPPLPRLPRPRASHAAPSSLPWPQCVQHCCEKFMKHSARVGLRFGELSSAAESQMQQVVASQTGK